MRTLSCPCPRSVQGIGMFAVPTGILFSAFEDMLETNKQLLEDRSAKGRT